MRACTSEAVFTTVVDGGRTTVGRKLTVVAVPAVVIVARCCLAVLAVLDAVFFVAFDAAFFVGARGAGALFFVAFVFCAGAMGRTLEQSRVC
jgi:hypothetical protein